MPQATEVTEITEEEMVKPLAEEDGWQIARASFTRELAHYSLRGGIALAILGTLAYAAFWAFDQIVKMPPEAMSGVQKILSPVQKYLPFGGTTGGAKVVTDKPSGAEVKSPSPTPTPKNVTSASASKAKSTRQGRKRNRRIASKGGHGHVRPVQAGDDPTGGRVTYRDGMITEYSWK